MKNKMINVEVDKVSLTRNGRITMKVPDEAGVAFNHITFLSFNSSHQNVPDKLLLKREKHLL